MKVLVVALDSFGDLTLRQPLLSGLLHGGNEVAVVVRRGFERVLPLLDPRLTAFPVPFGYREVPSADEAREALDGLSRLQPDLVVRAQFDPIPPADWILRRLSPVRTAGFEGGVLQEVPGALALERELDLPQSRPLDIPVACASGLPEIEKNARLLEALLGRRPEADRPRLVLPEALLERGRGHLAELGLTPGAYVACCPAGTANVELKAWPPERFARLVSWLARERGVPVLILGHRSEARRVALAFGTPEAPGLFRFLGRDQDFELMTSLLALSRLFVGNDTGPMHLAAACDVPVVAVFGGGHWPRFLPAARAGAAHTQELACFGCGWGRCFFGDAPCVGLVEEGAVRASVARVLDGGPGFEVHVQPSIAEEEVRARPLQRFSALSAAAARELDGLIDPAFEAALPEVPARRLAEVVHRVRTELRISDESAREIAARAERLETERAALATHAAEQAAWIREQGAEIARLDAVARRAPLVSVVTPTLDAALRLERCILSVRAQDYARVEHIVVDGGSTDGTLEICARYPHLVVCSAPDSGRAEALNRGFAMARGDVLAWLGADDEYHPRAISIAVDTILEGHDAVVGLCQLVGPDGQRVGPSGGATLPEQGLFWRRRLWERAGPLRQAPPGARDHDFWLRMGRLARFHRIGTDLASCRIHAAVRPPARKAATPRRRLRIALFDALAVRSGSERFTAKTAEGLLARGHDVRLYVRAAMPEGERPHYLRLLPRLPLEERAESSFRYRTGLNDLFLPGTALFRFLPWLASADVWHFHNLHGHFVSLPALAAASWTKPVLLSPLDDYLTTGYCTHTLGCERDAQGCGACPQLESPYPGISRDRTRILRRMKRVSVRASRFHLLLHTRSLEARYRSALPWARIRRLRHGVNVHAYRPVPRLQAVRALGLPEDGRFVVGAIHTNLGDGGNGILGAVEGLRTLAARLPNRLRVLVAGHGGEAVVALANKDVDVRYVGFVHKEGDMSMVLSCCDVLVLPTRAGNLSFTCLEALSCGVPVVSYEGGGHGEAVRDGVNGLLVPPEAPALVSAVERLARDPDLRGRLARGARETAVREFDLDRYLDELVLCYEELAGALPPARVR